MLEVKPPKNVGNSPKIGEAIFSGLWGVIGTGSVKFDKYIKGKFPDYFTLEIVGIGGDIHFLVRTQRSFRNLVEAHIYAQYPDAEIKEVQDYIDTAIPIDAPSDNFDLWGTVLRLTKDDCYPIKTYLQFLDISSGDEDTQQFLDPMSSVMEVMTKLKPNENLVLQIFVEPIVDTWKDRCVDLVGELIGKPKKKKSESILKQELLGWGKATNAFIYENTSGKEYEFADTNNKKVPAELPSKMLYLSPGERETIQFIEATLSKKGFKTKMQLVYSGRKDVFQKPTVGAIMGALNQFASLTLNGFKPNKVFTTVARYLFADQRLFYKKRTMVKLMRGRSFWEKGYVLNTEELATIWHFPTTGVLAPSTPRVTSRKGEPPVELPIE